MASDEAPHVNALCLDRSERRLLTAASDGVLRLWNYSSGQLLFEMYSLQQRWITDDDKALEERVKAEIGVCPSGELSLADTIRCQQQYRLPLINGWSDR